MSLEQWTHDDVRVAAGLAANALLIETLAMLRARGILTDDQVLMIVTGAIRNVRALAETNPHPCWEAAEAFLQLQAEPFGGPPAGSKPS